MDEGISRFPSIVDGAELRSRVVDGSSSSFSSIRTFFQEARELKAQD